MTYPHKQQRHLSFWFNPVVLCDSQEKVACVRVDVSPDTPGGGSSAETFL